MALVRGTRLGPYEISAPIGAGGMGEVYRARDTLFYRSAESRLMVARYVVEGDSFHAAKEQVWSETPFDFRGPSRGFDLHPAGRRFAVLKPLTSQAVTKSNHVTLIINFADELRRIAPARTR